MLEKPNDPNEISCQIIKKTATDLLPFLQLISMQSLKKAEVPKDQKIIKEIPKYKKGYSNDTANYYAVFLA